MYCEHKGSAHGHVNEMTLLYFNSNFQVIAMRYF